MPNSLIDELPKIISQGKKEAQRILDGLSKTNRITLQTNELVLPTKAKGGYFSQSVKEDYKKEWFNRLIYGDNLFAMQALLAGDQKTPSMRGKIDLIYIDPPFDSKADYRTKITLPQNTIEQKPAVIEQFAYADTWKDGTVSYLEMMVPRLILMRELLSEQGSIYVHIDWHVGHYVKVIMDEIFGKENFQNEIVWQKCNSKNFTQKNYSNIHDTIYFYRKSIGEASFTPEFIPLNPEYVNRTYRYTENDGRRYRILPLHAPGESNGTTGNSWRGMKPLAGNHWRFVPETLDKMYEEGLIVISKNNVPGYKKYLDDSEGIRPGTIWYDIKQLPPSENTNYGTQKPEELLRRIIIASSDADSIVADFFSGSGTTGAVAEKLGRKWIMSDLGKPACMIMRKRLIDQDSSPFLFQSIGDYQKEQFEVSAFKRIGDLAHVVINLYGALPFPQQENITNNNLGYIKNSKTLVFVDSPTKMTGYATLKKAQQLRNSFMGGWSKVVVLGWNFVPDIGQVISGLNDENLEVLVIPPDLLDMLKSKKSYEQLIKSGELRFSSLQYLTIKPISRKPCNEGKDEELVIGLENYILLSPEAMPLDEKNREILSEIIANDPLSLIEYWSIDPDYDGEVFRSKWQDYRENIVNDDDPYRVVNTAQIVVPKKEGKRKICVKAVDVFGFESVAVAEVG